MSPTATEALSPLDGRYAGKLPTSATCFSEAGPHARARAGGMRLGVGSGRRPAAAALASLPRAALDWLAQFAQDPATTDVAAIKDIESRTNHDVKAVEYWIRAQLQARGAFPPQLEWVHFGCTSEDINNLAYALMLKAACSRVLLRRSTPSAPCSTLCGFGTLRWACLARTHGQTATPTTVGKELANIAARCRVSARDSSASSSWAK